MPVPSLHDLQSRLGGRRSPIVPIVRADLERLAAEGAGSPSRYVHMAGSPADWLYTPLAHCTARELMGTYKRFAVRAMQMLLDAGADPNQREEHDIMGVQQDYTALMWILFESGGAPSDATTHYAQQQLLLLGNGADIDLQNADGDTALHVGCKNGAPLRLVQALVDAGADLTLRNADGHSALDVAEDEGHMLIADLLRRRTPARAAQLDAVAPAGWPPLITVPDGIDDNTIPPRFLCSITKNLMRQPAITPAGFTYEYSAIMQWIDKSPTDPMARAACSAEQLYPNRAVHEMIEEFIANRVQ